jgi:hypothetical protein
VTDLERNVYVGSYASVQKITPGGSVVGVGGPGYCCPPGWSPNVGPGIDASTNIYAATSSYVWKLSPGGTIELFAGGAPGFSDGPRLLSGFQSALDAFVNGGTNVFVSDQNRIRKIRLDGSVTTFAGTGVAGLQNGRGDVAQFNGASGICADTNGNIFVADSGNNCIRQISPDTYSIGIPDWWQRLHFGHAGIDPNDDPDHDGMSNYAEFSAGTDPLDAASALRIDSNSLISNGLVQIRWQTVQGKTYTVRYSTDLVTWSDLANPVQGDGTVASVSDPAVISQNSQRYYRIVLSGF